MLYSDRIDVSKGIHVNKTSESKECDICHYWYFQDKGHKFQPYVCNSSHDVLTMSVYPNDIAFLNIDGADYRYIIRRISKREAENLHQKS